MDRRPKQGCCRRVLTYEDEVTITELPVSIQTPRLSELAGVAIVRRRIDCEYYSISMQVKNEFEIFCLENSNKHSAKLLSSRLYIAIGLASCKEHHPSLVSFLGRYKFQFSTRALSCALPSKRGVDTNHRNEGSIPPSKKEKERRKRKKNKRFT